MSIIQFLRILWARKWIIMIGTVSCIVGAVLVGLTLPPRWQAHSRVMLELLKPDPVTGQMLATNNTRAYVATQVELIKDYAVAGQVADDLGLLSDPNLIASYQNRNKKDTRDFRRFVTQRIVDGTSADLVEGSNILEITYTGSSPEQARIIADALRKAYLEASRNFRVEQAAKNAEWYEQQAEKARAALDEAEKIEADYEKANNIILQPQGADLEAQRLSILSSMSSVPTPVISAPVATSPLQADLARLDTEIAEQSKVLGPNHPTLIGLRNNRAALQQRMIDEQRNASAAARAAVSASTATVGAVQSAMNKQKQTVIAQRDKVERARQLQADVELRRGLYKNTEEKVAEFRHEAAAPVTNLTLLGSAVTPQSPKFPNWSLIEIGSLILGVGVGLGTALLMELFGRRVRGPEDLVNALEAPLLAVITASHKMQGRNRFIRASLGRLTRKTPAVEGPKAAAA